MAGSNDLTKNEEFLDKFADTETPEEAVALFKEYGVEISKEELVAAVKAAKSEASNELDENALDDVAGGSIYLTYRTVKAVFKLASEVAKHSPKRKIIRW